MPGKKTQKCKHCGTPETPCWRKIEGDSKALYCNRCALFHKRHGRHRPLGVEIEDEEDYEFCPAEEIMTEEAGVEQEDVKKEVKQEEEEVKPSTAAIEPVDAVKAEEEKKTKKNQKKTRKTKKSKERYEWEFSSFMCSECKREYRHLNSLKMHCKKAHNGKGWQKLYSNVTSQAYAKHRDFICPLCGVECATHLGLRRHMTAQHSDCASILAPFYERKELCLRENKAIRDKVIRGDNDALEDFLAKLGPVEEEAPRRRQHQKVKKTSAKIKVEVDEEEDEEYVDLNAEASDADDTDKENEEPVAEPEVSQRKLRPRRTKSEKKPLIESNYEETCYEDAVKEEPPATPELLCKDETFVGVSVPLSPDPTVTGTMKSIKQEHVENEGQSPDEVTSRKKRKRSPASYVKAPAEEAYFSPEKKQRVVQTIPAVYPSAIPQIAQIAPIIPGAALAPVPLIAPIGPIAPNIVPVIAPVGIEMVPYIPVYAPQPQPEDIFYNPELFPAISDQYFGTTFESQPLPTLSGSPSVPTDMLCNTVSSLQTPQCGTTDLFDDMMELFEDAPLQIKVETEN